MLDALRDYIRPLTVAAMVFVLLAGATASGILEAVWPGLGKNFTVGVAGWFRAIPDAYYQLTAAGLLGYAAGRSMEKITAIKARVDDPKGGA